MQPLPELIQSLTSELQLFVSEHPDCDAAKIYLSLLPNLHELLNLNNIRFNINFLKTELAKIDLSWVPLVINETNLKLAELLKKHLITLNDNLKVIHKELSWALRFLISFNVFTKCTNEALETVKKRIKHCKLSEGHTVLTSKSKLPRFSVFPYPVADNASNSSCPLAPMQQQGITP